MIFWHEDLYCKVNYYLFSLYNGTANTDVTIRISIIIIFVLILLGGIISQSLVFFVHGTSLHIIMDVLPGGLATAAALAVLMFSHYYKSKTIQVFSMIEDFYNEEDHEDVIIMWENSVKIIKKLVKFITVVGSLGTTGMFSLAFVPLVFDMIAPLNESRPLELMFSAEFFIDKHKYFYPLFCYQFVGTFIIVIIVGCVLNLIIVSVLSTCTIFMVIGYHLQSIRSMPEQHEMINERLIREKIVNCIVKHKRVVELVWLMNQCAEWLIFMGLSVTIIVFTLSAVQVMSPESFELKILMFTCAQLADVFIGCLLGQHLMDTSLSLADKIYDSKWYECPMHLQKLLLFTLMRTQQPAAITFKGVVVLCNKSLGAILQTAMSYCMVLRQFQ